MWIWKAQSDTRIINEVLRGDRDAFRQLVEQYSSALYGIAYARLGNHADAEDVVQETFLRALKSLNELSRSKPIGPWLVRVARNTATDVLRSRGREVPTDPLHLPYETHVFPHHDREELYGILWQELHQLEPDDREILLLYYVSRKKTPEIAALLEISTLAAVKRLQRARNRLGLRLVDTIGAALEAKPVDVKARHERIMAAIILAPVPWRPAATAAPSALPVGVIVSKVWLALLPVFVAVPGFFVYQHVVKHEAESAVTVAAPVPISVAKAANTVPASSAPPSAPTVAKQNDPAQTAQPTTPGTGSLSGIVFDEDDRPVLGATVRLETYQRDGRDVVLGAPVTVHDATTNGAGEFTITGVEPVLSRVSAYHGTQACASACFWNEDNRDCWIPLTLKNPPSFQGRVVNESGQPVAGAYVEPYLPTYKRQDAFGGTTDETGVFILRRPDFSTHQFYVDAPGYARFISDAIAYGAQSTVFVVRKGVRLAGKVVRADSGAAQPDVKVWVCHDGHAEDAVSSLADGQGGFVFDALPAGAFEFKVEHPTLVAAEPVPVVTLVEGQVLADVTLPVTEGAVVAGIVIDDRTGEGYPDANAHIMNDFSPPDSRYVARLTHTDASGRFEIAGLPSGTYHVSASLGGKCGYHRIEPQATFSISAGQAKRDLEFHVKPFALITGIVRYKDGSPVPHAWVDSRTAADHQDAFATCGADGQFCLRLPTNTEITLMASGRFRRAQLKVPPLDPGEFGGYELVLEDESTAELGGIVTDADGRPFAGIDVEVDEGTDNNQRFVARVSTDAVGRFTARHLHAGTYGFLLTIPFADRAQAYDNQRISLSDGERNLDVQIAIDTSEARAISGRVTDSKGRPLKGIALTAINGTNTVVTVRSACTGEDGKYTLYSLLEGKYKVTLHRQHRPRIERENICPDSRNINFQIEADMPKATVKGRVIDAETRQPIQQFRVWWMSGEMAELDAMGESIWSTPQDVQDPTGKFEFTDVEPPAVRIGAMAEGYDPVFVTRRIAPDSVVEDVVFELKPNSPIEGVVRNERGQPVPNATVSAPYSSTTTVSSDAVGHFRFDKAGRSVSSLKVSHVDYPPQWVEVPEARNGVRYVEATLRTGGCIEGVVTSGGQPVVGASIQVEGMASLSETATTDASGSYTLPTVGSGIFLVHATGISEGSGQPGHHQSRAVAVEIGQTVRCDFAFPELNSGVEGFVSLDGAPATNGTVSVSITLAEGQDDSMCKINPDGAYHLAPLAAGHALVTLCVQERQRIFEIDLPAGGVAYHDVAFAGSATVFGSVTGSIPGGETGVGAIAGYVNPPAQLTPSLYFEARQRMAKAVPVEPDGSYRLENLEPGEYTIGVLSAPEFPTSLESLLAVIARIRVGFAHVTLTEGQELQLDLVAQPTVP